jgi:hypothetical protein
VSRYYSIVIGPETAAPLGNPSAAPSGNTGATFTNQVNGMVDLGAHDVELDIPVVGFAQSMGMATVTVWGVSKAQVSQAADFQGAPISVYGGMQNGLPLATAAASQAGLLVAGTVFQSFGNWQGVVQNLVLVIANDGGLRQDSGCTLAFTWKKGTTLAAAIQQTLAAAYPSLKTNINISSALVLPADEMGVYQTIQQFAGYVKDVSQQIVNGANQDGTYPGVDITLNNGVFSVFDGSSPSNPKALNFQDFIGQITWIDAFTVQFNMVMRSDIAIGDTVTFPSSLQYATISSQSSNSQARNQAAFQGTWTINMVRSVGRARGPAAQDWITTFRAFSSTALPDATNPSGGTSG